MGFVNLHVHTEYSLLDGASSPSDLVLRAKELGQTALAITDHGFLYGILDFYKTCKKNDIKPIIGVEIYFTYDIDMPITDYEKNGYDKQNYHLILLAKDMEGYKNLIRLSSIAATKGLYDGKPRIDLKYLKQFSKGLVCSSACLGGIIPSRIQDWYFALNDKDKLLERYMKKNKKKKKNDEFEERILNIQPEKFLQDAYNYAKEFKDIFSDNFYLELQTTIEPMQKIVNEKLIEIGKELDIQLIVTSDTHYARQEDYFIHDAIVCVSTGKMLSDDDRMKYLPCYHLFSEEEVYEYLSYLPKDVVKEAIDNTQSIADMCSVDISSNRIPFPKLDLPDGFTPEKYLENLVYDSFFKYGLKNNIDFKRYQKQIDYELKVINEAGFAPYFLVVRDYIKMANDNGIMSGPGRGSAAGSLVTFLLGITKNLDPIKNGLLFERFLNPERKEFPDIDSDFEDSRRNELIDMLYEKYGKECVAHIGTLQRQGIKNALKDAARILGYDHQEINEYTKRLPTLDIEDVETDEYSDELSDDVKQILNEIKVKYKDIYDIAIKLYGKPRSSGIHASGILVAGEPLFEYIPLRAAEDKDGNIQITTQFDMNEVAELGGIKFDILGLKTLSIIKYACDLANIKIDINNMQFNDRRVYETICSCNTEGVFQIESQLFKRIIKEWQPKTFEEITALLALGRPGPLDSGLVESYIRRKKGFEKIEYEFKELEDILKETYGILVYQEDVMKAAQVLAGYTLGQADGLRKAIGKKKMDLIAEHRKYFIEGKTDENGNVVIPGGIRKGYDKEKLERLYDKIEKFGSYAFNKSHSAAYAVLTYITAYLKTYYLPEFLASIISFERSIEDIGFYINHAFDLGIDVLPPDINKSQIYSTVENGKIRLGFKCIKDLGSGADSIILERKNGPFRSFEDFYNRIDKQKINKSKMAALILSGAFSEIEDKNPHELLNLYYDLKGEKCERLDTNITNKMLGEYEEKYIGTRVVYRSRFEKKKDGDPLQVTCTILDIRYHKDKSGRDMCFLKIQSQEGTLDAVVFASVYRDYGKIINNAYTNNEKIKILGKKSQNKIVVDRVQKI